MYICPHDLMALTEQVDPITKKSHCKSGDQQTCNESLESGTGAVLGMLQLCQRSARSKRISIRCYADFAPLGGEVIPIALVRTVFCGPVKFQ